MSIKSISVFCGSSPGAQVEYVRVTRQLGKELAQREICLVYGGGSVGLMGELASAALSDGGQVIGVIPEDLYKKEIALEELSDLRVVPSMHERKAEMVNISDGFIALPGGYGTFEEFFEVLTWAQLKLHEKPCGFLNVNGYFDILLSFLEHSVEERFIGGDHLQMVLVDDDPGMLLDKFYEYSPPSSDKAQWAKSLRNQV